MPLDAGTKLGRYEIRAKIGEGGMGEVYRAYDPAMHREVAVKLLPAALSTDKGRLARFGFDHQHLQRIVDGYCRSDLEAHFGRLLSGRVARHGEQSIE